MSEGGGGVARPSRPVPPPPALRVVGDDAPSGPAPLRGAAPPSPSASRPVPPRPTSGTFVHSAPAATAVGSPGSLGVPTVAASLSPRLGGSVPPSPRFTGRRAVAPHRATRPLPPPPPSAVAPAQATAVESAPVEDAVGASDAPAAVAPAAAAAAAAPPKAVDVAKKRGQVCLEILATEERYAEQLGQIVNNYERKLLEAKALTPAADRSIFSNVTALLSLHEQFLQALLKVVQRADDARVAGDAKVGTALSELSPALAIYVEYVNHFHDASLYLRNMYAQSGKFRKALDRCSHSTLAGLTGLETLLVVPVQRIPRYCLLLREVLKFTPPDHVDHAACATAFAEMEKVASLMNEKKREYESAQRLAFVSEHLAGGNMGALRETVKAVGRKHDFVCTRLVIPRSCDYCKELCHLEFFRCAVCGYQAHSHCYASVAPNCSEGEVVDRDTKPELIREYRKIVREEVLLHKCTHMDKPSEYEATPLTLSTVLLCNDSLCILRSESAAEGATAAAAAAAASAPAAAAVGKFTLVDLVKWSSSVVKGPNAVLNDGVAVDMFSVANRRGNLLHTFKLENDERKKEWVTVVRKAMDEWQKHVQLHDEHEAVLTEKLTGLHFNISGTIPVASANEKPFTVFVIEMSNSKGTLTILKRYRQLLALHRRLCDIFGEDQLPPFPRKKLIGNTDEKFLQKRSRALTQYLQGVTKIENVLKLPELRQFLTTTVSAKNEDELLPAFQSTVAAAPPTAVNEALSIIEDAEDDEETTADDSGVVQPLRSSAARPAVGGDDGGSAEAAAATPVSKAERKQRRLTATPEDLVSALMQHAKADADVETALLLYDYDGAVANSLAMQAGTVVVVQSKADGWWYCVLPDGRAGYLPEAYLQEEASLG